MKFSSGSKSFTFNGHIDSVRIYEKSLTSSEVYNLYAEGLGKKFAEKAD